MTIEYADRPRSELCEMAESLGFSWEYHPGIGLTLKLDGIDVFRRIVMDATGRKATLQWLTEFEQNAGIISRHPTNGLTLDTRGTGDHLGKRECRGCGDSFSPDPTDALLEWIRACECYPTELPTFFDTAQNIDICLSCAFGDGLTEADELMNDLNERAVVLMQNKLNEHNPATGHLFAIDHGMVEYLNMLTLLHAAGTGAIPCARALKAIRDLEAKTDTI